MIRRILNIRKWKVTFYLEGGHKLVIKCDSFEMSKLTSSKGQRELSMTTTGIAWSIDIDTVLAYTCVKNYFW